MASIAVSDTALALCDSILGKCDALGGTFDPAASPVTGGYGLTKGDAARTSDWYQVRVEDTGSKPYNVISWVAPAKSLDDAKNQALKSAKSSGFKNPNVTHASFSHRTDSVDALVKEDSAGSVLREKISQAYKNVQAAIRNKDAEEIKAGRERVAQLEKELEDLEVKKDADSGFKPGDYVMDRETQKMGTVVETTSSQTKVEWRDGKTSTVKTSTLKG